MGYCYSIKKSDKAKLEAYEKLTGNHPDHYGGRGGFWYIRLKDAPPDEVQAYDSFNDFMEDIDSALAKEVNYD